MPSPVIAKTPIIKEAHKIIEAIKENRQAANNFEIAAKVTEIMLLTNVAVLSQQLDITLEYDAKNMKITNLEEANQFFHYNYRDGWKL